MKKLLSRKNNKIAYLFFKLIIQLEKKLKKWKMI